MRGAGVPDNVAYLSVNDGLIDKKWSVSTCTADPISAGGGTLHFESAVVAGIAHFRYFKNPLHSLENFREMQRRVIHGPSYSSSLLINYRLFRMYGKRGFFMNFITEQPTDTAPTVVLQTPDSEFPRSYDPPLCRRGQLQSGTKCFPKRYFYRDKTKFSAHSCVAVQAQTNAVHWHLTIEGWVAVTGGKDMGYFQDLISCGSDRTRSIRLGLGNGGVNNQVQAEVGQSMRSGIQFEVKYFKWNHYAVSKTTSGTVTIFINGVQMDSYSRTVHIKCDALYPIDQQSTGAQEMTGYATEFRVWPTARTLAQIQATMHRRLTRAERMGTLAYYYLDQIDLIHNNMAVDKSPSGGISYMGGYSGSYNNDRFYDVDYYQAGWAPVCEYYEEYDLQYHRCRDPQKPQTPEATNPTQVALQTTKGTVRMEVDLPYEAGAGVKDYTLTLWTRIVSISATNPQLKSVLVCQRKGSAEADGLLLSTQENSDFNELEFYANYKNDKTKVIRHNQEHKLTGGDWMYLLINSNQVGTNFFVNDIEQGSFSLFYMPLFDPQGSFVFGDCDGSWRVNSVRFSELRLWTVFKTPAELASVKLKLFDYSHADILAEQLELAMLMPLRNVDLNDYAQDTSGVLNPVSNVDDAWTSTEFYTELFGYSAADMVQRRLKEPLSLKVSNNEAQIPVTNLTVASIKKGITVRSWIRPDTLNKRLGRVLCVQNIFSVFVNNAGSMYLVYKAKRVGVNSASISKWNQVFISISRKFSILHVNDLEDRLRYKHLRTIVPSGVSSITSAVFLGSSELSSLLVKELIVLNKPLKYSGEEFTLTDNKLLAYWRFQIQNDTLYELLTYKLKEAQDVRIAAGAVQTEIVPLSIPVNTTAALSWEEDPDQDDFALCDPGVKRNSDNSCSFGVTNFALLYRDSLQIPIQRANQLKLGKKGFTFMFMFNLLDTTHLSASGSTFVTLDDNFLIKLLSTFSIKSTIAGTDYSTPDNSFVASSWVHISFIYHQSTTKYKVVINGVQISNEVVTPFPSISKTLFTGVGNTLLKNLQFFARPLPLTYVRHSVNLKMDASKLFRSVVYYYPLDEGDGSQIFQQVSREPITGDYAWFSELDTDQVSLLCPAGEFFNTDSNECESTDKSLTFNKSDGSGGIKGSIAPIKTSTFTLPEASHSVGLWINPARCLETVLKFSTIIELKLVGTELQYKSKGTKTLTGTINPDQWQHWAFAFSPESYYLAINGVMVDDPRGLQSDLSLTDGFIIGADAEDATSSALEASIGTISAYSSFKETSYYTSNMYNNPLFENEDDTTLVSYFQPASELTDWVSGESVTISADAFVENEDEVLFADGQGIYNPESEQFSTERYLSFESASISLNRASANFTLTAWFIKRATHDFTLTLDTQSTPSNKFALSLSNNLIYSTIEEEEQNTLLLMKQINPTPAKIDDWVMIKISSHLSCKYEIIINYVSQSVSYTNTTYREATGTLLLDRLAVASTNVTFQEMLYYGYSIPNEAFTRDLSVHSIFPNPDIYYKFDQSYGTQVLDHSIYSDSNLSPNGIEWMVELPIASEFSFSVNDPICPTYTDFYDPVAGACVATCPGGTRNNTQLICVELICLDSYRQEEEACILTGQLTADSFNKLTLTLNGNATLSQDPIIYSSIAIEGERAPYQFQYSFVQPVGTTASEFQIYLQVNNTLRGFETLTLNIPRTLLINQEGHSFSTQTATFEVSLNKQANPEMEQEISESEGLALLVSIVVGITIALLLILSLFSKATKLHNAWSLAYSLQLQYLLMFVNTTLPLNAQSFFQGMKFFNGQVEWIEKLMNPIAKSVQSKGVSDGPVNRHFEILGITSSYFVVNVQQVLYIICLLFILSMISTGVGRCAKQADELKNARCCERLKEAGTCNFWVRIIFSFYTSFCFFSFISLYQINMSEGGTAALLSLVNIFSAIFVFSFLIILTVGLQGIVKKLRSGQKVWNKEKNYFLLWTDFDNAPRSSFGYYSLWIATRLIIAAFIVFAQKDPVAQCLFIAITSLFMGTFVMAARPFKQMVDNLIEMLEALFFAFSAVLISHIERKSELETEESLLFYGDILIFITILSLGIRGVFVLSDLLVGFMGVLKLCKRSKAEHIRVKRQSLGVIKEEPEEQGLTKRIERRPLQTVEEQFPGRHMTSSPDKMPKGRVNSTTKMLKRDEEIDF